MIANAAEYENIEDELRGLGGRLERLRQLNPFGSKRFTKAGTIRNWRIR